MKRSLPRRERARESGKWESRAPSLRVKAMEAVKSLVGSREGLPGVWGAERSDGGGGNWGGPPWSGDLRVVVVGSDAPYNR